MASKTEAFGIVQIEGRAAARAAENISDEQLKEMGDILDLQRYYIEKQEKGAADSSVERRISLSTSPLGYLPVRISRSSCSKIWSAMEMLLCSLIYPAS